MDLVKNITSFDGKSTTALRNNPMPHRGADMGPGLFLKDKSPKKDGLLCGARNILQHGVQRRQRLGCGLFGLGPPRCHLGGIEARYMGLALFLEHNHIAWQVIAHVEHRPSQVAGRDQLFPKSHEKVLAAFADARGSGHLGQDAEPPAPHRDPGSHHGLLEGQVCRDAYTAVLIHVPMLKR